MHPDLRIYYDFVHPVFWPWLWWNMMRVALWHLETGRDALLRVDRFGNIRFVFVSDAPKADDLYEYKPPSVMPWERLAIAKPLLLGEKGLGMRGRIVSACEALAATPSPLTPALARANAVRSLIRASPNERGASVRGPPHEPHSPQTPAQAGVHGRYFPIAHAELVGPWMPAFAGIGGEI